MRWVGAKSDPEEFQSNGWEKFRPYKDQVKWVGAKSVHKGILGAKPDHADSL